jgi:hypothetical protein
MVSLLVGGWVFRGTADRSRRRSVRSSRHSTFVGRGPGRASARWAIASADTLGHGRPSSPAIRGHRGFPRLLRLCGRAVRVSAPLAPIHTPRQQEFGPEEQRSLAGTPASRQMSPPVGSRQAAGEWLLGARLFPHSLLFYRALRGRGITDFPPALRLAASPACHATVQQTSALASSHWSAGAPGTGPSTG